MLSSVSWEGAGGAERRTGLNTRLQCIFIKGFLFLFLKQCERNGTLFSREHFIKVLSGRECTAQQITCSPNLSTAWGEAIHTYFYLFIFIYLHFFLSLIPKPCVKPQRQVSHQYTHTEIRFSSELNPSWSISPVIFLHWKGKHLSQVCLELEQYYKTGLILYLRCGKENLTHFLYLTQLSYSLFQLKFAPYFHNISIYYAFNLFYYCGGKCFHNFIITGDE